MKTDDVLLYPTRENSAEMHCLFAQARQSQKGLFFFLITYICKNCKQLLLDEVRHLKNDFQLVEIVLGSLRKQTPLSIHLIYPLREQP